MGVKILVYIRHIRGHTFEVEVDREADCIGLKLAVWEAAHIAVEAQRLVYAGKEITDDSNLVSLGIDDGSTIFLVERSDSSQSQVNSVVVPSQAMEHQPMEVIPIPEESISVESVPVYQPMAVNSAIPSEYDRSREERIHATIELAFWVKVYCVFGFLVSLFAMIGLWVAVFPMICYILGHFGCRKLNRCYLVFPLLISIIIGPMAFLLILWNLIAHFWAPLFAALLVSFLHILIMASICKLRCRVKHLSEEEKAEAVLVMKTNTKCWCC